MKASSIVGFIALGLLVGGAGCATEVSPSPARDEATASTAEALEGQLYNNYSVDVGFGIERVVGETCGTVCVKTAPRSPKSPRNQPAPCLEWTHSCVAPTQPLAVGLYASDADKDAGRNFPPYNEGANYVYEGCGPAAAQNVLGYFGVKKRLLEIAGNMTKIVISPDNIATLPDDLANALRGMLNQWGDGDFKVSRLSGVGDIRLETRLQLAKGNPVVLLVQGGYHYQVVTGLEAEKYFVIDYPANGGRWISEVDLGLEFGAGGGKWAGMVVGGGYEDDTMIVIERTPKPTWHAPAPLPTIANGPVFKTGGGLAAASRDPSLNDAYAIGFDGKLWSVGDYIFDAWHPPVPVTDAQNDAVFVPGGGIAAVSRDPNHLDTFAIGYDGQLWIPGSFDTDHWTKAFAPVRSDASFTAGGGIAASARNGVIDTFAIASDGRLWDTGWWDASGWHTAYSPIPHAEATFQPGGGLAAVSRDNDHVDVYAIGYDGQLWNAADWDKDHWNPAAKVPTDPNVHFAVGAQIAATARNGVINTWVIGNDGQLWNAGWYDGTWHNPYKVVTGSNAVFPVGGGITATNRADNVIDTLAIGYDQKTWSAGLWAP